MKRKTMMIFGDAQCYATYLDLLEHLFTFHIKERNKKERKVTSNYWYQINSFMLWHSHTDAPYSHLNVLSTHKCT